MVQGPSIYDSLQLEDSRKYFRLLTLQPSRAAHEVIVGELARAEFGDRSSQYEALSYSWEDDSDVSRSREVQDELQERPTIQINGQLIAVKRSVLAALTALRHNERTITIWVDELCIDQGDKAEKSIQVALMDRIYSESIRTIVWLGHADATTEQALREIEQKRRNAKALMKLLRRRWFRRVWVVQEVAVAPHVLLRIGKFEIQWDDLIGAIRNLPGQLGSLVDPSATKTSDHLHPAFHPLIMDVARMRMQSNLRFGILEALRSFRPFNATEGLDKVFALRALLADPNLIDIDYNKSITQVYRETAATIISHDQNLDVLADCLQQTRGPLTPGLPSWAPDWHDVDQPLDHPLETVSAKTPYCAARGTRVSGSVVEGSRLMISGYQLDEVVELAREMPTVNEIRDRYWPRGSWPRRDSYCFLYEGLDLLNSWKQVAARSRSDFGRSHDCYPTNETATEVFWNSILIRGPSPPDVTQAKQVSDLVIFAEFLLGIIHWHRTYIHGYLPWFLVWLVTCPYLSFWSLVMTVKAWRKGVVFDAPTSGDDPSRQGWVPGRTKAGFFGLFPGKNVTAPDAVSAMPEDAVFLSRGSSKPLILRKEEGEWRLIGDAYIHGIMYGAAFDNQRCEAVWLK